MQAPGTFYALAGREQLVRHLDFADAGHALFPLDLEVTRGNRLRHWATSAEIPMESRVALLEAEMHRLRSDIERLKTNVWLLEQRTRTDWFVRACQVLIAITVVVSGVAWYRLG